MNYEYTKADVTSFTLEWEIKKDATITKDLVTASYVAPDSLTIIFATALSDAEKTALDTIVTNHDASGLKHYRLHCTNEGENYCTLDKTPPSSCPACDSSNITGVFEHQAFHHARDKDENEWHLFMGTEGEIIVAKSV